MEGGLHVHIVYERNGEMPNIQLLNISEPKLRECRDEERVGTM